MRAFVTLPPAATYIRNFPLILLGTRDVVRYKSSCKRYLGVIQHFPEEQRSLPQVSDRSGCAEFVNRTSRGSRATASCHFSVGLPLGARSLARLLGHSVVRNDAIKYVPSRVAGPIHGVHFRCSIRRIGDDASSRGTATEILGTPGSLGGE